MSIDLTKRWEDFAVYLPAIQSWYSTVVHSDKYRDKERNFPNGLKLTDLDYLNPKSKLWHYGYGLYSVGQFTNLKPIACSVSNRDKNTSIILGDSGGYQIGMGTFKGTEHLSKIKTPKELCDAWRDCGDLRHGVVKWLDAKTDYAMTIDMPLWVTISKTTSSPFRICTIDELIQLSVENLKFIKQNSTNKTKWLSVIQGTNIKDSQKWWDAVKKYRFSGWSLGGSVGWRGGLDAVLQTILMMRDEDAFEKGQDWMHVLGVSQPTWAVFLTAIQKQIREINPKFRISYDSASPFQMVGKYQQTVRYPKFTKDIKSWVMSACDSPINPIYENSKLQFPFPSPLGEILTLDQINVNGGNYQKKSTDQISDLLLINHTLYVYVRSFLEANELAFMNRNDSANYIPQNILEVIDIIGEIFNSSNGNKVIKKYKVKLDDVFKKITSEKTKREIEDRAYSD